MTAATRKILVTGATGRQGGAVVRHLLAGGFPVRALSRRPESDAARRLADSGVEVVKGDQEDRAALDAAVAGCHGVFSVQNYWEKGVGYEGEIRQGKNLADAAAAAGVQHFVQASVATRPEDEATAPEHFRCKFEIEAHVRRLGLPYTFIKEVFFLENFIDPQAGKLIFPVLSGALRPDLPFHVVTVEDIGVLVRRVFEEPERYIGQSVDIAGDILTVGEMKEAFRRATGKKAPWLKMPAFVTRLLIAELASQLRWNNEVGWKFSLDEVREHVPNPTTFEAFARQHLRG